MFAQTQQNLAHKFFTVVILRHHPAVGERPSRVRRMVENLITFNLIT
jgi:hypothetical protein